MSLRSQVGISAGVHDLINVLTDPGNNPVISSGRCVDIITRTSHCESFSVGGTDYNPVVSSGRNAQDVVEVMAGFVRSAHGGHVPVALPLPRAAAAEAAAVAEQAVPARL